MTDTTGAQFNIGSLAAQLGLNPKTIRYYEEIGLLPAPRRTASGYRVYGLADLERLQFISKAKGIGLSLGEIRRILDLQGEGVRPCRHVVGMIDRKLETVERQLQALEEFREELRDLRDEAARSVAEDGNICTIIEHHELTHSTEPALAALAPVPHRPSHG